MMILQLDDLGNNLKPIIAYKNVDFVPRVNEVVIIHENENYTPENDVQHHYIVQNSYYDYKEGRIHALVIESNDTKKVEETEVVNNGIHVENKYVEEPEDSIEDGETSTYNPNAARPDDEGY